jgi:threonylcarbamoyladenosine tRNA methylthiotransferase MtaB
LIDSYTLVSLGCRANRYESGAVAATLDAAGFVHGSGALVVCSCALTAQAERTAAAHISRYRREFLGGISVLYGCLASHGTAVTADIVTNDRAALPSLIRRFAVERKPLKHIVSSDKFDEAGAVAQTATRALVKIQDGCDRHCAYCAVPSARGTPRSRSIDSIQAECLALAHQGHRELILTGINLSRFSPDLLAAVHIACSTPNVERVRLSSLEPDKSLMNDGFFEKLAHLDKLCPHFHLSLQSGSNVTLSNMLRGYDTGFYTYCIEKIRQHFPDAALTTDVIVGFDGETDRDFADSLAYVKQVGFAKIHVFTYSPRKNTPATWLHLPVVPDDVKRRRYLAMSQVAAKSREEFLLSRVGKTVRIIAEKPKTDDYAVGRADDSTPVRVYGAKLIRGEVYALSVTDASDGYCVGEVAEV